MNRFVCRRSSDTNKHKNAQIRRYSNTRPENITNNHFCTTCVTSNSFQAKFITIENEIWNKEGEGNLGTAACFVM